MGAERRRRKLVGCLWVIAVSPCRQRPRLTGSAAPSNRSLERGSRPTRAERSRERQIGQQTLLPKHMGRLNGTGRGDVALPRARQIRTHPADSSALDITRTGLRGCAVWVQARC